MNKFVVRLPGGHQPKKASYDGKSLQQKSCNRSSNQCTQVYLDLGQKSMGRTEKCSTCHMLYVKDDIDDVRSHQEFCKQKTKAPILSSLTGHNVVAEFKDARESVVKVSRGQSLHKAVVESALERALQELGSSEDLVSGTDTIYLLVDGKGSVLGTLVCEPVAVSRCAVIRSYEESANKLIRHIPKNKREEANQQSVTHAASSRTSQFITMSELGKQRRYGTKRKLQEQEDVEVSDAAVSTSHAKEPTGAVAVGVEALLLGVKVVWVSPAHRRQSIARRLLDTARASFEYGTVVPLERVTFSQPTEAGFAFAGAYCQRDTLLAYA